MNQSGPQFPSEPQHAAGIPSISPLERVPDTINKRDLPPSALLKASTSSQWPIRTLVAAIVAAVALSFAILVPSSSNEATSPNWKYTQTAQRSADDGIPVQWRARNGTITPMAGIVIGEQDRDLETTQQVRNALKAGNVDLANQLVFSATVSQVVSPVVADSNLVSSGNSPPVESVLPTAVPELPKAILSNGIREEIERGDVEFYHIYLYDSCYEDGDIVEILIDGQAMFMVPIGKKGATVSVPIAKHRTTVVSVRGVYDGGGGITVGCRTSQGDGFIRSMAPEEIQPLSVVFPK